MNVSVIIPVLNEEGAIANVINDIPKSLVQEIIVVDNGCTDRTVEIALKHGAKVVTVNRREVTAVHVLRELQLFKQRTSLYFWMVIIAMTQRRCRHLCNRSKMDSRSLSCRHTHAE